ncbi:MAG: DUF1501 domain-containing protein [Bacteroidetes bacterium]|nr:DUF1501 domain-containing protein [Bacteroidota bacterium]
MNRRTFLKKTSATLPFIWGLPSFAISHASFFENISLQGPYQDRVLVLIQLEGGNDTLNTIIPLHQYPVLQRVRKNIIIPENKILLPKATVGFGFHPSMAGLQRLYDDKLLSIVHGVGYPDPDFSHFKGTDIKITANIAKGEGSDHCLSGWVGRYVESQYEGYPTGFPKKTGDGPPAVRIGNVSPKITSGNTVDLGIGFNDLSDFESLAPDFPDSPAFRTLGGQHVTDITSVVKRVKHYIPGITSAVGRQKNLSKLYPERKKNLLADRLKLVASLIGGDLRSQIYIVNQTGYDTHGDQVLRTDTTKGLHADLLRDLSEAIVAFQDDLRLMGKLDNVLGMTFSEFGRRIVSNESCGTDHGTVEAVFMFGTRLQKSFVGDLPALPEMPTVNDNMVYHTDFRAVYASVLKGWFGLPEEKIKTILPTAPPERLDLFRS